MKDLSLKYKNQRQHLILHDISKSISYCEKLIANSNTKYAVLSNLFKVAQLEISQIEGRCNCSFRARAFERGDLGVTFAPGDRDFSPQASASGLLKCVTGS